MGAAYESGAIFAKTAKMDGSYGNQFDLQNRQQRWLGIFAEADIKLLGRPNTTGFAREAK